MVDAFDLRIHQSVGGADVRSLLLSKANEQQEPKKQVLEEQPPKEKQSLDMQKNNQESGNV